METRQSICKFSLIQRHLLSCWRTLLPLQLLITARKLWYISARPVIRVIPANHKLEGYDFPISSTCADKLPGRDRPRHRSDPKRAKENSKHFKCFFAHFIFRPLTAAFPTLRSELIIAKIWTILIMPRDCRLMRAAILLATEKSLLQKPEKILNCFIKCREAAVIVSGKNDRHQHRSRKAKGEQGAGEEL